MTYKWTLPTIETHGREATESEIQMAFVRWFRKSFPDVIIFSVPNGGRRSKSEALKLKAEGVLAGVSDLMSPELKMAIELKCSKGGKVSKEQEEFIKNMRKIGYDAEVCNGFEEAKAFALTVAAKHGIKPCPWP